ncbi:MAG: pyridoxal phosphate-dependent aminotransferase family protein, partial [candidate division Zixibacteria bacterium]|nr:pyridoxal phosphate-dependent aminotransferase family protein [candidate division Zixibacteria bacterium]
GDLAPLAEISQLATRFGARLMVDDAHAIGVIGENGSGTASHFGVTGSVDIIVGTFSKSFASLGGFVAADEVIINYIKHMGRSLIFSASIPPSNAASALKSLEIMETEPERRENLWKNTHKMHRELRLIGFDIGSTETPIVPIMIGQDMDAFSFWRKLYDNGVFANAIISPATPPGRALIRTSYTATHTDEQLDRVLSVLKKVGKETGVI